MSILDSEFEKTIEDKAPEAMFKSIFNFELAHKDEINGMPKVALNIFTKEWESSSFGYRDNFYGFPKEELQQVWIYKYPKHKCCMMDIQDDMIQSWRMIKTEDVPKEFDISIDEFQDYLGYKPDHEYQVVRLKVLPIDTQDDGYRRSSSPILIDACIISHNHYSVNTLIKLADTSTCL